ncbi:MAG: hypothetical protein Q9196_001368 [Gyalolechia fulgens]
MDDKSIARVAEKKDKLDAQVKSVDMVSSMPVMRSALLTASSQTEEMQQQAIEVGTQKLYTALLPIEPPVVDRISSIGRDGEIYD